jgi:Spherulation-specific family 4
MPDAELVDPLHPSNPGDGSESCMVPDVTAVFEASYQELVEPSEWTLVQLGKCTLGRERQAYIVHSVPLEKVQEVTARLRTQAGHVFVTDLTEGFYCAFDSSWPRLVEAMAMR